MAEYDVPFSALRQRPSSRMQTRRASKVTASDDFTLTVTMYDDEDASVPSVILDATATLFLYRRQQDYWGWDYGLGWLTGVYWNHIVLEVAGVIATTAVPTAVPQGQIIFPFTPDITEGIVGSFAFEVQLATGSGLGAVVMRGLMEIERGPNGVFSGDFFDLDTSVLGDESDAEDMLGG